VRGAIAQTAEREYDGFASEERQAARQIFLRLTSLGDGTEDTRRPIGRAELDGLADPVVIAGVLDRLAEARLVVLDEETVQVAHEALIRSWPRLQRWLGDDRATLLAHRRLTEAARGWEDLGRDPGVLYRGAALATTAALAETELNGPEKEFLEASRAQEGARSRALRRWVGALAVLLSLALLAGFLAVVQSREARMRERLESAHQLALTSRHLLAIDPDLSGLVAIEAYRLHPDLETRGALLSAAFAAQRRVDLNRGGTPVFDVEVASDGSLAASAGRDGAVTLWDLRRRVRAGVLSPDASTAEGLYMRKVAFSADSLLLASLATHPRGTTPGVVTVWDLRTRRPVFQERRPGLANALAFSEDGTTLAVGVGSGIELWDLRRGTRKTLNAHTQQVSTLALNASGTLLASANVSEPPVIWDVRSGKPRARVPVKDVHTVAFDEGGDLVTGSLRHGVHFWDVAGGKAVRRSQLPGGAALTWDMSDPKGGRMAVVDENGLITVWDLHRREPITTYQDRGRAEARSVALSGTQLVSAGIGRTIVLREPAVPAFTGHFGAVTDLAVSPGDAMVATAGADRTVRLWTPDGRPAAVLEGHSDRVTAIDFSPDGSLLAALTRDHTVTLWNTATRQRVKTVRYEGWGASMDLAYHPRGTAIATAALALRWWDAPGLTRAESSLYAAGALKFSPDGQHLIATNPAGGLQVLDLATKKAVHEVITDQGEVRDVAISPDGSLIATAGADRTVKIWQSRTGGLLATLTGHTAPIRVLAFSRDGRRLASGGEDQLVIAWEVGSWRKAAELTGHRSAVEALAFTHAGELLSGGLDGRVIRWRFSPAEAADQICREVGRDLTPGERAIYVPGEAQSPGCGAFAGLRPS
jgi:WD40 repeat protein